MNPELDPIYACENIIFVPTWADGLDDFVYCCALCVEAEVKFYCQFIGLEDLIRFFYGAELGFWDDDPRQKY